MIAALCVILAASAPPAHKAAAPSTPPDTIRFSGSLKRGQRFGRPLRDGMRFLLSPTDEGWDIHIVASDTTADFAGVVTPPFHGPNPLGIMGWHFKPDSKGAPGTEREFQFALNEQDQRSAASALDVILWPGDRGLAAQDSAQSVWDNLPRGEGLFEMTDVKIDSTANADAPPIAHMAFRATLIWPPRAHAEQKR